MQKMRAVLLIVLSFSVGFAAQKSVLAVSPAHTYTCEGGEMLKVTYFNYPTGGPSFMVLDWNGQSYGLALAPAADGGRYASLYGLEWWEAQGSATLSTFTSSDTNETRMLLTNCTTAVTMQ